MSVTLKPFGKILEADSIWRGFVLYNRETGIKRERTLRDHYSAIEPIQLVAAVPNSIQEHFDTARNLLVYAWFVYSFLPVAQMHAFSSVEYAIRVKSGRKLMLKQGLELAIKEHWITDKGFHYYKIKQQGPEGNLPDARNSDSEDFQAYCKILSDAFPYIRNELAHGNPMTYPGGLVELSLCADLINQLFDPSPSRFETSGQGTSHH